ncbi:MAG: toxin-activating lysine-acyltransferase [Pseudomonadota bacterium]
MPPSANAPSGWFDIEDARYSDLGAMVYLSGLTETHQKRTLAQTLYTLEPPWRLNQYHIFRQDGFARGFVTFAGLSADAEYSYGVLRQPLSDRDYASGASFWIVDLVAPFGQVRQIVDLLKSHIPHATVRTNRLDSDLKTHRIVEWFRDTEGAIRTRILNPADIPAPQVGD